jgi:RimJ/RimL family protein N-acetyltransferase
VPRFDALHTGDRGRLAAYERCLGKGYATEAARATLDYGFDPVGLDEIVSFTTTTNLRSQRVMRQLGMTRDPVDDFDRPCIERGHNLQRHVLYRISRGQFNDVRSRIGFPPIP